MRSFRADHKKIFPKFVGIFAGTNEIGNETTHVAEALSSLLETAKELFPISTVNAKLSIALFAFFRMLNGNTKNDSFKMQIKIKDFEL